MATEVTEGGQANLDLMSHLPEHPEDDFAADFVDHDPAPGQPAGETGLQWYWAGFADSFSDIERNVVETVATPEHVVTVMDLSGTHTGDFMGHPATGRRFTVRNVQVMKIVDGERTERWGSTDQLGILQQLGLADGPSAGARARGPRLPGRCPTPKPHPACRWPPSSTSTRRW